MSLALCCGVFLNACSTTDIKKPSISIVEEVNYQNDKLTIPYKKYKLSNGLELILHQDNSDPLVHVDVTYHVGSAREEPGKSGFAHFFEHMMFQGSKNIADEAHFKIITEAGGTLNGTTNSDRTNYYQTVPANQLEKVLWLESDRMGFMLEAVTSDKFEVQRETVKNERGQRYDNRPYGLLSERVDEALYPKNHPYSWQTIGYVDDLNRVTVADLKAFFLRWYGPNNATLTIGGDIDIEQTLAWVERYFGEIPMGPEVKDEVKTPVSLSETRYISMEDEVHLPLVYLKFPTVQARHEDEAPLDILSDILGTGKTSLFYKNLVKSGYAINAAVNHPCQELACSFSLYALANPQKQLKLSDLEQVIRDTLLEFEQRGVTDADLQKTQVAMEASTIYGLQSVHGKVSTLAYNNTFGGEPDKVQYDLDRYNAVTKADVMRVFKKYIKDKHAVVMSIVPKGKLDLVAKPDNYTFTNRKDLRISLVNDDKLDYRYIDSAIDRTITPIAKTNKAVKLPEYWQSEFDNGIKLIGTKNSETPTITLSIGIEGGTWLEDKSQAGLASLTADLMNETTKNYSNEAIAQELEKLGSSINVSASGRYTWISLSSLTKNLDKSLELLEEKLFKPAFNEVDFTRLKNQTLQHLAHAKKNPDTVAKWAFNHMLYGQDNRISYPDVGTIETLEAIKLSDVKAYYSSYYSPKKTEVVIVGDIDKTTIINKLSFLTKWQGQDYSLPKFNDFPKLDGQHVYFLHQDKAKQSVIRLGKRSQPYDATGEHFKSKLMNFTLGGAFNSRINLNLREDKGYTYGARSGFRAGKNLGQFVASAGVKQAHTADSLAEIRKEINLYQSQGLSSDELVFMQKAFTQSDALEYETPQDKALFLQRLQEFSLSPDYVEKQMMIINQVTVDDLNAIAKKELNLSDMQTLIVGDRVKVLPQLEKAGYKVIELSSTFKK